MKEMELDQPTLARRIGCKQPSISALLSKASKQSTLVPAIHAALKWPPPPPVLVQGDVAEIASLLADMPAEDVALIKEQVRSWRKRQG